MQQISQKKDKKIFFAMFIEQYTLLRCRIELKNRVSTIGEKKSQKSTRIDRKLSE